MRLQPLKQVKEIILEHFRRQRNEREDKEKVEQHIKTL